MCTHSQKSITRFLSMLGVDEAVGQFVHDYIDFKVRREMRGALTATVRMMTPITGGYAAGNGSGSGAKTTGITVNEL